jgi:hypothetical protein
VEIYIGRFLPGKILNIIYQSMISGDTFPLHSNERRMFLKEMFK